MAASFTEMSPEDVWGDPPPVLEARRARPLLEKFFERWPTAKATRDASAPEIEALIEPLQLGEHAAELIKRFSGEPRKSSCRATEAFNESPGLDRLSTAGFTD